MIYEEEPENFEPTFEVVGCFVEVDGKILLLHRQDHKPQGGTWGCPAGKVDEGENIGEAIVREVMEETGLNLPEANHFKKIFVRLPDYDFVYHIFHSPFEEKPEINLRSEEHKDFQWASPEDALGLPLVLDEDLCIKLFFGLE
ncbi:NUDIX domain-containing protein [archaeon]|jgi:8-oxo-dGTP diphosphatase|nr:NUDIX domain-containing protein [archaeon]MBT3577458.1 NUDIX domain-containing protein [archaeon]MBT6820299.1 NUDIX domain-containing protein [archaeon]MBT6955996.1 NUDIX domain-containing protein [archaeon]MBT7025113.1 NUDIX domain-containing protein [archaeon]